jgi:hypothetical protein
MHAGQMDEKLANLLRRLRDALRRRDFFVAFSQSPVDFINALVASQARRLSWHPLCSPSWATPSPCVKLLLGWLRDR